MQRFERHLFNFINYLRHIALEVIKHIRYKNGKGEGYGRNSERPQPEERLQTDQPEGLQFGTSNPPEPDGIP